MTLDLPSDPYFDAPYEEFDFNLKNKGYLTHTFQEKIDGEIKTVKIKLQGLNHEEI